MSLPEKKPKTLLDKEDDSLLLSANRAALLMIIQQNQGALHGYAIGEKLSNMTNGALSGSNAVYYSILRQMKLEGLVKQDRNPNDITDTRLYYSVTPEGQKVSQKLWQYWIHYFNILKELNEHSGK